MPSAENLAKAEQFKNEGNGYLKSGDPVRAIKPYTQAINLCANDATLYSNRAFAFTKANKYERALLDADKAIHLKPLWHKGHFRRGEAFRLAGLHASSLEAYKQAAKLDPSDEHLGACVREATKRAEGDAELAKHIVYGGIAIGVVLAGLLLASGKTGSLMAALVFAVLGGPMGFFARMCWEQKRLWAVATPTMSNDDFVKSQFKTLQSSTSKKEAYVAHANEGTSMLGGRNEGPPSGGSNDIGKKDKVRGKTTTREAAMRSKGK